MNLKEALTYEADIRNHERITSKTPTATITAAIDAVMKAAKRELARRGNERRTTLADMRQEFAQSAADFRSSAEPVRAELYEDACDVLGALRTKVVPWLRKLRSAPECMNARDTRELRPGWENRRCSCCHRLVLHEGGLLPEAILEALGEPL